MLNKENSSTQMNDSSKIFFELPEEVLEKVGGGGEDDSRTYYMHCDNCKIGVYAVYTNGEYRCPDCGGSIEPEAG